MWWKIWAGLKIFRKDVLVLLIAVRNPATPRYIKVLLAAAFVYLISPLDLIPDAIPVVGLMDDMTIVPAAVFGLLNLLPAAIRRDSETKAQSLGRKMPYLLFAAAILLFAWGMFLVVAIYSLLFK
jgi:Uncharacterized conserved protein